MHMCSRVLLLFGKLPQWNLHVNCHVNGTTFQSGLGFQTGLSSLRVSCKRALRSRNLSWRITVLLLNWSSLLTTTLIMFDASTLGMYERKWCQMIPLSCYLRWKHFRCNFNTRLNSWCCYFHFYHNLSKW